MLALLRFPFDLVRALAEGVAMGLEVCYPMATPPAPVDPYAGWAEVWRHPEGQLAVDCRHKGCILAEGEDEYYAEAKAEREAWEMNELRTESEWLGYRPTSCIDYDGYLVSASGVGVIKPQTSSRDGAVTTDPVREESPAAAGSPGSSAAAGHPNVTSGLAATAAFAIEEWMAARRCANPPVWQKFADELYAYANARK